MPHSTPANARYLLARMDEITPQPCPCGYTRRAFVPPDNDVASIHLVEISADSRVHYHKRMTEIYFIREGEGYLELDGEKVPVSPNTSVLIRPGCRHRAVGALNVAVIAIPAFDPDDEWFD